MRSRWAGVISRGAGREQLYTLIVAFALLVIFMNWYSLALLRSTLPF
jgi:hypothetical protein